MSTRITVSCGEHVPGWLQAAPLFQTLTWPATLPCPPRPLSGEFWHSLPEKAINKVLPETLWQIPQSAPNHTTNAPGIENRK